MKRPRLRKVRRAEKYGGNLFVTPNKKEAKRVKIVCTKKEFCDLIRACAFMRVENACRGCALSSVCGDGILEDSVEIDIVSEADPGTAVET